MPISQSRRPTVEDAEDEWESHYTTSRLGPPRNPNRGLDDDSDDEYQPSEIDSESNMDSDQQLPAASQAPRNPRPPAEPEGDNLPLHPCANNNLTSIADTGPLPKLNAGEEHVPLPGRDVRCPKIYLARDHPLRRHVKGAHRTYFYFQDTSIEGMIAAFKMEVAMKIPDGTHEQVINNGWLELKPGDALFSRDIYGTGLADHDVIQAWVASNGVLTTQMTEAAMKARDYCLGPADLRSPSVHKRADGSYEGGTAFQRTDRITPLKHGSCYTLSTSYERPTNKTAPCKDIKMQGDLTEHQLMRQKLISAVSPIAMAALREGSIEAYSQLEKHASLINSPRVGSNDNFAFPTSQLNIAPAQRAGNASLRIVMSVFGGEHFDRYDNAGYFTNMHVLSDLPETYDPGRFFILYCGVLHQHGGTAPTAPPGEEPSPDAFRFVVVSYPPMGMTSGTTRYSLGAMPGDKEFVLPPEMINVDNFMGTEPAKCGHGTYLGDGRLLQTLSQQVSWTTRSLLCMCQYFLNQLPESQDVRLNPDIFTSAFSYMEDGVRHTPQSWNEAPGYRSQDNQSQPLGNLDDIFGCEQKELRVAAQLEWEKYYATAAGHIPFMVANKHAPPLHSQVPGQTRTSAKSTTTQSQGNQTKAQTSKHQSKKATKRKNSSEGDGHPPRKKRRMKQYEKEANPEDDDAQDANVPWSSSNFNRMTDAMDNPRGASESSNTTYKLRSTFRGMLDTLNLQTLTEETIKVANDCDNARSHLTGEARNQFANLEEVYGFILDNPTSPEVVRRMGEIWHGLEALKSSACHADMAIRWEHACIMGSTYAAWYWLDIQVARACDTMIRTGDCSHMGGPDSWLARLAKDVENFYIARMTCKDYSPSSFSLNIDAPTHTLRNSRPTMFNPMDDPKPVVRSILTILRTWLHFSNDQKRAQAWFVHCILQSFGKNALFLEEIWPAFSRMTLTSFKDFNYQYPLLSDLDPIVEVFRAHPLATPTSPETAMLKELGVCITSFHSAQRVPRTKSPVTQQILKGFNRFLQEAYEVLSDNISHPPSRWQEKLKADPNHLTPFREFIPARAHFKGTDGPFAPEHVRTTAGALSALIWRGVTFGTEFSEQEAQKVFQSAAHFEAAMDFYPDEDDSFFCDKKAYGQWADRSTENVKVYEASLKSHSWTDFIGDHSVSFTECYDWLQAEYRGEGKKKAKFFPQIGKLTGYLLTCDFVYAGVVDPPSNKELAAIIGDIDRGGIAGLRCLGLLANEDDPKDVEKVTAALTKAMALTEQVFTPEQRRFMVFDNIMMENVLCKFARAIKRGLIELDIRDR
ncbi:hypothetical protein H0H93_003887 [Arthromyces matolae]|nr:hypothetical protein H0H93_003887 [Arthromyces matolae]